MLVLRICLMLYECSAFVLTKTCCSLGPRRIPESGIRKIGMFRHVFAMFWNPSVSFLNTSGNLLGTSGRIGINKNFGKF